jgi:ribokinase
LPPDPPRLTVVGSVNLDLVARCDRLPRPGETVSGATFSRHPGGKGANQAVAAARLGASVTFVGSAGEDELAEQALSGLQEEGVETTLRRGGATGVALILVDEQGENQIVVAPGANSELRDVEVSGAVLSQLEIPIAAVEAAAAGAARFFLNAAPARALPAEVVRAAELVIVNRYELEALPETPRLVALTLGEEGAALLEDGREVARARAPRVRAVDGTAAGDAFTACLVVSHLQALELEEALRRACAAGAIAASRPGAQPSLPTSREVDEILSA